MSLLSCEGSDSFARPIANPSPVLKEAHTGIETQMNLKGLQRTR